VVLQRLRTGVAIEGGVTAPAKVGIKSSGKNGSKLSFLLTEGKKREIRRMCVEVGHRVQRLVRVGIGPLRLGDLPLGEARRLRRNEISALRQAVGLQDACKPSGDGVQKSPRGKVEQSGARKRKQSPRRIRD
jgi:23S rRNA pseudouridine2605 synthase